MVVINETMQKCTQNNDCNNLFMVFSVSWDKQHLFISVTLMVWMTAINQVVKKRVFAPLPQCIQYTYNVGLVWRCGVASPWGNTILQAKNRIAESHV